MTICFDFDATKSAQAMAYIVSRMVGQKIDKVKLMKLLYLADRDHFLEHERPITGDDQYAMPFGPVPTLSLDLLDGQFGPGQDGEISEYLQTQGNEVSLRRDPCPLALTDTELAVLDATIRRYGSWDKWWLTDYTHELPEYRQMARPKTSTRIPFEVIRSIYSKDKPYRNDRPIITPTMAANMICPFPCPEPDL